MEYFLIEDKELKNNQITILENDYGYYIGFKIDKTLDGQIDTPLDNNYNYILNCVNGNYELKKSTLIYEKTEDNYIYLKWLLDNEITTKKGRISCSININKNNKEEKRIFNYNSKIFYINIEDSLF